MSDWQVAINELTALVRQTVREELRPTGVTPGVYNSVTVGVDGRIRFGAAGGGGMQLVAVARGTPQLSFQGTVPANTERRMQFDQVYYDPGSAITTGTAWSYTAPSAGWYQVHLAARLKRAGVGGLPFDGAWDAYIFVDSDGGTTLPSTLWDENNHTQNSQNTDLYMRGVAHCYVSAGGAITPNVGWQPGDGTTSAQVNWQHIVIFKC